MNLIKSRFISSFFQNMHSDRKLDRSKSDTNDSVPQVTALERKSMARTSSPITLSIFSLLVFTLAMSSARAGDDDDKELAKKHFKAGLLLLEVENYAVAADEFKKSIELYPTKTGYFNLASCHRELKNFMAAMDTIGDLKIKFAEELDGKWQDEISAFEQSVAEQTQEIALTVNVTGATVEVNGLVVGKTPLGRNLLLAPGDHKIEVLHKEHKDLVYPLTVVSIEKAIQPLSLSMEPKSAESPPAWETQKNIHFMSDEDIKSTGKRRVWTWVAYSICGAAGVSAIVTGALNLSWTDELKKECGGTNCRPSLKDEAQLVQRLGTATNVLIGVSAASLILGTILLFAEGRDDTEDDEFAIIPLTPPSGAGLSFSATF